MKREFNVGDANTIESTKVTLECTSREFADLWYAVEQQLSSMKLDGLQGAKVYSRLIKLQDVFNGKNSVPESN